MFPGPASATGAGNPAPTSGAGTWPIPIALGIAAVCAYIGIVALANFLTAHYGFVPVGFGLEATAGTYAIGCAFVARILIQESFGRGLPGRLVMLAAILAGALLSFAVATPALAVASGVTFLVSETADWLVYTPIRARGWAPAAAAGNAVGDIADTFLFLWLAGFPIVAAAPGQLVGKIYATLLFLAAGGAARGLLRHPVRAAGA